MDYSLMRDPRPDLPAKPLTNPDPLKPADNDYLLLLLKREVKGYLPTILCGDPGPTSLAGSIAQRFRMGTSQADWVQITVPLLSSYSITQII